MTQEEKEQYAQWLLERCNEQITEIVWLLDHVTEDVHRDIQDNVLKFLNSDYEVVTIPKKGGDE